MFGDHQIQCRPTPHIFEWKARAGLRFVFRAAHSVGVTLSELSTVGVEFVAAFGARSGVGVVWSNLGSPIQNFGTVVIGRTVGQLAVIASTLRQTVFDLTIATPMRARCGVSVTASTLRVAVFDNYTATDMRVRCGLGVISSTLA